MTSCRYANDASDTLYKETKASTLLKKYEYFKDVAAALDARQASIVILEGGLKSLVNSYEGEPRSKWAREDREDYNLKTQEIAGLKMSYNTLASEYNAAMAKANWAFCNVGDLPEGATNPLPREFKPYIEK